MKVYGEMWSSHSNLGKIRKMTNNKGIRLWGGFPKKGSATMDIDSDGKIYININDQRFEGNILSKPRMKLKKVM